MAQPLNPWWLFHCLSTANLLKGFNSPLPLHKVSYQLGLDYLALALIQQGPAPLAGLNSQSLQSPIRQTNLTTSLHFPSFTLTWKGSHYCFHNHVTISPIFFFLPKSSKKITLVPLLFVTLGGCYCIPCDWQATRSGCRLQHAHNPRQEKPFRKWITMYAMFIITYKTRFLK